MLGAGRVRARRPGAVLRQRHRRRPPLLRLPVPGARPLRPEERRELGLPPPAPLGLPAGGGEGAGRGGHRPAEPSRPGQVEEGLQVPVVRGPGGGRCRRAVPQGWGGAGGPEPGTEGAAALPEASDGAERRSLPWRLGADALGRKCAAPLCRHLACVASRLSSLPRPAVNSPGEGGTRFAYWGCPGSLRRSAQTLLVCDIREDTAELSGLESRVRLHDCILTLWHPVFKQV